jgi:hypothetical protein
MPFLSWSGVPSGPQLETVCDLIFRFLSKRALQENGIFSGNCEKCHAASAIKQRARDLKEWGGA